MALSTTSDFPTSLDSIADPGSGTQMNAIGFEHSNLHAFENDAIENLQTKVGVDSSAVTTTHDYKLSGVTGSDVAASLAGTETLTNKTLTTPKINEAVNMTATSTELNIMDGIAASTAELNIMDGVTASTADLNATTNFEETISATTSEVTIATAKTINVTDNSGLKLAGTAVAATAAELNITDGGDTTEKVLNVQSKARAYLSSSVQSITSGSFVKINVNVESYDIGSDYNTGTYRFVTPVAGYYDIKGSARVADVNAGTEVFIALYVDGSPRTYFSAYANANGNDPRVLVSDTLFIAAAKDIELYVQHNHGSNRDVTNGENTTWLAVHLLSI